jgi:hypothetical protein
MSTFAPGSGRDCSTASWRSCRRGAQEWMNGQMSQAPLVRWRTMRTRATTIRPLGSIREFVNFHGRARSGRFRHWSGRAQHRSGLPRTRGLTLPSRGSPQAGFAHLRPPLMSNVERQLSGWSTDQDLPTSASGRHLPVRFIRNSMPWSANPRCR